MGIFHRNAAERRPWIGASIQGGTRELAREFSLLCFVAAVLFPLLPQAASCEASALEASRILGSERALSPRVEWLESGSLSVRSLDGSGGELSQKLIVGRGRATASHSDADLVEGVRKGDSAAFAELVRRFVRVAHSVAYSVVGSPDLADDVCQEAFITALQRIEQCRHPDRFRGWLLTIVRNRALNLKASESFRSGSSLDTAGQFAAAEDPDVDLERSEINEAISQAADQLSGLKREVYRLHDLEGLSHSEIAETLGISKGASRVHLHMARKKLKARLSKTWTTEA